MFEELYKTRTGFVQASNSERNWLTSIDDEMTHDSDGHVVQVRRSPFDSDISSMSPDICSDHSTQTLPLRITLSRRLFLRSYLLLSLPARGFFAGDHPFFDNAVRSCLQKKLIRQKKIVTHESSGRGGLRGAAHQG